VPGTYYIRKRKRPDGSGFWGAHLTGDDGFGSWLFTPRGSLYRGEAAGNVGYCSVGSPEGPGIAVIHLAPRAGWWIATFWPAGEVAWAATFDICTPPELVDDVWEYVDLELDIWVDRATREVHVQDEDEFDSAVRRGIIPTEEAAAARAEVENLCRLLSEPDVALLASGETRLSEALGLGLQPITRLP
jgi:hypothetical protein